MMEFFEAYKYQIIYITIVVVVILTLRIVNNLIYRWILKQREEDLTDDIPKSVRIVKRILNTLWTILGLMSIILLFVGSEASGVLERNQKLILHLGLVSVFTIVFASTINIWFKRTIQKKIDEDQDFTSFKFLRYVAVFFVYSFGVLIGLLAFPSLKGVAQTALGGAGVLALIAGVASQEALANLVGGVFIISFKPFKIGDVISLSDNMIGKVVDITLRHTVIRNSQNRRLVIPNAIINKEKLTNYDLQESKLCEYIEIGISYDSNIDKAKAIMREICESHQLILDNRTALDMLNGKPLVRVSVIKLDESSVNIRAWAWAKNFGDAFDLKCDVLESIKKRFDTENIEIPFPYRTVVIKGEAPTQINNV